MIDIQQIKDGEWVAVFNEELEKNLVNSSNYATQNANDILCEANILYENSKYPRSAALAILAEEEFAKSILLKICIQTKTWNAFFHKNIKQHTEKQALAESINFLFSEIKKIEEGNKVKFIPLTVQSVITPGSRLLEDFYSKLGKQTIEKKKRDLYKQSMLYISIGKTGILTKSPGQISQKEAAICIDYAEKIKEYSKIVNENLQLNHLDARFRQHTIYNTNSSTYWTICHKDGFDISLDIFNLLNSSPDDIRNKIEIFLKDIETIEKFFDQETRINPKEEIARCREFSEKHKMLDQIKEQKRRIGVKYSRLEELIEFTLKK